MELFGIKTKVLLQSQLQYDRSLRKNLTWLSISSGLLVLTFTCPGLERVIIWMSPKFGTGIRLEYSVFQHPVYPQRGGVEFVSGLSCLDMLFNQRALPTQGVYSRQLHRDSAFIEPHTALEDFDYIGSLVQRNFVGGLATRCPGL